MEDWKISKIIKEEPKDFGINNIFPSLSTGAEEKRDQLFLKREELIEEYKKLREIIGPLLDEENRLWYELQKTSTEICNIEGHRLSELAQLEFDEDEYRQTSTYYRICIVCGKRIYKTTMSRKDVV